MMSSALALAAVTSVLVDLLENRLIQREVTASVGAVAVTSVPPDKVAVGAEERSGLNLFLYRFTPDTRWRRDESRTSDAASTQPPPLYLGLHYLLTAYGERDLDAEILLGYAMQALLETPALSSEAIRTALAPSSDTGRHLPPGRAALSAYDGTSREKLTICPEFLSMEEMSRLWSSLQARYRPSTTYTVSAVAIEAHQ
jgi:hypothetical protein